MFCVGQENQNEIEKSGKNQEIGKLMAMAVFRKYIYSAQGTKI